MTNRVFGPRLGEERGLDRSAADFSTSHQLETDAQTLKSVLGLHRGTGYPSPPPPPTPHCHTAPDFPLGGDCDPPKKGPLARFPHFHLFHAAFYSDKSVSDPDAKGDHQNDSKHVQDDCAHPVPTLQI